MNNRDGLIRTAQSLTRQVGRDFEWIVIDGASEDNTRDWLKGIEDPRMQWISEPDAGPFDAMNKGLGLACGKYILFLNAGDCLADPGVLNKIHAAAQSAENLPGLIYGDSIECFGKRARVIKQARPPARLAFGMITHHQAIFYRRELIADQWYNTSFTLAADYDLTARVLRSDTAPLYVDIPICVFEGGGLSHAHPHLARMQHYRIRAAHRLVPPGINEMLYVLQVASWGLRVLAPDLYRRLRYPRHSSG